MIACYRRPRILAVVRSPDHNPQRRPLYLAHFSGDSGLGDQNHQGYWSPGPNSLADQNHGDSTIVMPVYCSTVYYTDS